MKIDWSKAPEGTTHAGTFDGEVYWRKIADGCMYAWDDGRGWGEVLGGTANQWKEKFDYIEKPTTTTTIQQLRSIVQQSGLQIEFHADGTIYVWDDTHEEGTRVNSLDEYVRLAEAKAAYVKLWTDYIWE
jgi:hypothetical protein